MQKHGARAMYSALQHSVSQKPNNWLPVRHVWKPKANMLATGPQSVNHASCCQNDYNSWALLIAVHIKRWNWNNLWKMKVHIFMIHKNLICPQVFVACVWCVHLTFKFGTIIPLTELSPSWELPIVQLLNKFPAFYGTQKFITMFARDLHWFLFWARSFQSIPSHPISLKIHFNIVHPPTSWSSQWSLTFWLSHQYPRYAGKLQQLQHTMWLKPNSRIYALHKMKTMLKLNLSKQHFFTKDFYYLLLKWSNF
jgi:hypothetical protein